MVKNRKFSVIIQWYTACKLVFTLRLMHKCLLPSLQPNIVYTVESRDCKCTCIVRAIINYYSSFKGTSIMLEVLYLSCLDVTFYNKFLHVSEAVFSSFVVLVLIKFELLKKSSWELDFIWRLMLLCAVSIPWVLKRFRVYSS